MYLNLHVLFSFAAANPNRDDAGSPKTVTYGNATRSRISSQAMTRPKRLFFEADLHGETTYRSTLTAAHIVDLAVKMIAENGHALDDAGKAALEREAALTIRGLTAKKPEKAETAPADTEDTDTGQPDGNTARGPKATLVWLAESEMLAAARKLAERYAAKSGIALNAEEFLSSNRTDSLSIAAFGRMFAQRPDLSVEAAIQRGHAFTTHETANEVDYFAAVDDLRSADKGAGHLSIAELTAGVYYWHANVDIRQLQTTWNAAGSSNARSRLAKLFEALFLALPTGKQNSTAHHTIPAVVLAVPARLPVSLQTAFEAPVRAERPNGFLTPSIDALFAEHMRTVAALPSYFSAGKYAGTAQVTATGIEEAASLDELAVWCADQVLDEQQANR